MSQVSVTCYIKVFGVVTAIQVPLLSVNLCAILEELAFFCLLEDEQGLSMGDLIELYCAVLNSGYQLRFSGVRASQVAYSGILGWRITLSDSRNAREHGSMAYLESSVVLAFGAFEEELE